MWRRIATFMGRQYNSRHAILRIVLVDQRLWGCRSEQIHSVYKHSTSMCVKWYPYKRSHLTLEI